MIGISVELILLFLLLLSLLGRQLQALYYLFLACAEDAEIQKHGMTVVIFRDGLGATNMQSSITGGISQIKLLSALPVRITSSHLCFDRPSQLFKMLESTFKLVATTFYRVRNRSHFGTTSSCERLGAA